MAIFQQGNIELKTGKDFWEESYDIAVGLNSIPDFEVSGIEDFDAIFGQLQIDLYSLAGIEAPHIWSMKPSK